MFSMRQMLGRRPPAYKAAIATMAACAALICERADAECTLIDDMREYATADAQRDDERRLALASAELAKELERRGMAPAAGDAMRCWIQKVSNLILNINVEVRTEAGATRYRGSVDIRGNTDESWLRGVRRLAENLDLSQNGTGEAPRATRP
jgi:hypothetical protein